MLSKGNIVKSQRLGKSTSRVEVQGITPQGIWLWVSGREYFLCYEEFPWFRKATIDQVSRVELHHGHHLHWPQLDVDLELDSLDDLEKYPLISN